VAIIKKEEVYMTFAPEDKRAWAVSEVMSEFEKVAKENDLLNGGPVEAYLPIPDKIADEAWEDENFEDEAINEEKPLPMESEGIALVNSIKSIARKLASDGNIKGAYRVERAFTELNDIIHRYSSGQPKTNGGD
jgi:hypothetical protein